MAIYFENGLFRLLTDSTEYQMRIDELSALRHVWYGEIVGSDMSYLLKYPDMGFSGNPSDAGSDRTYSFDTMSLEYPCMGNGDMRITAASITHPNGSTALDLRYMEHRIHKGKYGISGLPAVYCSDNDAETLEITMRDKYSDVQIILRYGVIEKYDIITRSCVIVNGGAGTLTINNAAALSLDIPHGNWEWLHFHGRHAMERITERSPIIHGIQESSSRRGASSHHQNPSVIICSTDCTEEHGKCYGAFFVYSGDFRTQIQLDQLDQVRLTMGINPDTFTWHLDSGEAFETPEAVLTFSAHGFAEMSHNFHRIIRNCICRGKYKLIERPVLINNWEATYFDFNAEKLLSIARQAADMGIDMFVLDDGWFGERNSDNSGLGDWFVNESKLGCTLGELADSINSLGMSFGIWFEPEMISENSKLYHTHPEWVLGAPNRPPVRGRNQLVLDMSRSDVRDYLFASISAILDSTSISYIKWDMNRSITDSFSNTLTGDRQGELHHRYMLGVYELLECLTTSYPDVLFEGCSGGGGRFDAGMLYYCPQIWCSDNTDAFERTKIQYGTSFIYPCSAVGAHVSIVPNHQTGRITPLSSRAVTAMAGSFGFELDTNRLTDTEKQEITALLAEFRELAPLIHNGLYYRLSNPLNDNFALWEFISEDKCEVLVQGMIYRTVPNMKRIAVRLMGLDPDLSYNLDGEIFSGAALMNGGVLLPTTWGDYSTVQLRLSCIR